MSLDTCIHLMFAVQAPESEAPTLRNARARAETENGPLLKLYKVVRRPDILLRISLALTFLLYLRTIAYDFVFDDHLQVAMNPWLTSWSGLKHMFTQHSWAFADIEAPARYYRPLYLFWLWAIRMPTDGAPGWFHLGAILSHLGVCCLVFLLARRLLQDECSASVAALLFALHPTKIEAVAWIGGASEVVHAAFFLGMFIAYFQWRDDPRWPWLAVSVGCFMAALLAKETAVVGPVLILLYESMSSQPGSPKRRLTRLAGLATPFCAITAAYAVLRTYVLGGMGDLNGNLSWIKTGYTTPLAFLWYLKHLAWPFRLSAFYPEMVVRQPEMIRFAGASAVLVILAVAYSRWAKGSTEMKFLGIWLVATLAPPVSAILLLQQHDRYLYLPSFAFAVIMARLLSTMEPKYAISAVISVSLLFAASTFVEEQYWETDIKLFTRATKIAPELPKSWELLAATYADNGEFPQALEILRSAYSKWPQDTRLAYALAQTYVSQGDSSQAEKFFQRTLEICGDNRLIRVDALYELALIAEKQHRYLEAESLLRTGINIVPNSVQLRQSLARVLQAQNKPAENPSAVHP